MIDVKIEYKKGARYYLFTTDYPKRVSYAHKHGLKSTPKQIAEYIQKDGHNYLKRLNQEYNNQW